MDVRVGHPLRGRQLDEFLTSTRAMLKVGTNGADGFPLVNAVWFVWEEGAFWVVSKPNSGLVQNILRDSRACLLIDSPEMPYSRVTAKAIGRTVDLDWRELNGRMMARYTGVRGVTPFAGTDEVTRLVLRFDPVAMTTWDGVGSDRTFFAPAQWRRVNSDTAAEG